MFAFLCNLLGFAAMFDMNALSGTIMRNAVIRTGQIRQGIESGLSDRDAIRESTVRRFMRLGSGRVRGLGSSANEIGLSLLSVLSFPANYIRRKNPGFIEKPMLAFDPLQRVDFPQSGCLIQ